MHAPSKIERLKYTIEQAKREGKQRRLHVASLVASARAAVPFERPATMPDGMLPTKAEAHRSDWTGTGKIATGGEDWQRRGLELRAAYYGEPKGTFDKLNPKAAAMDSVRLLEVSSKSSAIAGAAAKQLTLVGLACCSWWSLGAA